MKSAVLEDLDRQIRKAVREFGRAGDRFIGLLNRRDGYQDTLRGRRPSWCDTEAAWLTYQEAVRAQLTQVTQQIADQEAHLTRAKEALANLEARELAGRGPAELS